MTSRTRIAWTLIVALMPSLADRCCAAPESARSQTRPNIILVMPDDVGYGDFACLGNPVIKTPNVDAFWKQSVRFTDFHVSPTCAPTRCALMTGRHEFKSGVTHTIYERERMSPKAVTLAETLRQAGYATGIFGKWHLGDEAAYQPDRRGFDEHFIHGAGGIGQTFPGSCGDAPGNMYFDPAIMHNGRFEKTKGYCTDLFFGQATKWIDAQRQAKKPFFAYITPNAAHSPLQTPEENYAHYRGKVPDDTAKFFGMVENIDENFGRLMSQLDKWGLTDDTLVIFMTDNGGTGGVKIFNAGMHGGKNTPYEGGTRVPSMWRWPARWKGGHDVSVLAAHLDIYPTLAELAQAPLSEKARRQIEGRSLVPLLMKTDAAWPDRTIVTHCGRWKFGQVADAKYTNCSIRNSRYKLVNNTELYDLKTDPAESKNILDENPQVLIELRRAYDAWWDSIQGGLENEKQIGPDVNPYKAVYWKQFGGGPTPELLKKMRGELARER